jgi:hypothetical protein
MKQWNMTHLVLVEKHIYKEIYTGIFGSHDLKTPYWMPQWIDTNGDPSGRKLEIFKN